ncbi:MAG: 3-keto-5-aminohexanoate cleavage protein [Pleurocapsa sp. MO_192.B19]|nr:3-keto-5-aminohexanoate cleavage protein [Pleurocapsa sp. MO_192.B19]
MFSTLQSNPCIITCAISGITSRQMNRNVPITPQEQACAIEQAFKAGARVAHVHPREDDGSESHRPERYQEVLYEIKSRCPEIIVEISTRATSIEDGIDRGTCVELTSKLWGNDDSLKPDLVSLNAGTLNLRDRIFLNSPLDIELQARRIYNAGIVPELDIFEIGQMENAFELLGKGVLQKPLNFLFVLGSGGISADPANLLHLVRSLPPGTHWTGLGAGRYNFAIAALSIHLGGHVRTGLEDTTYIRKGVKAKSNAQLVEQVASLCEIYGRPIATPQEARKLLGLASTKPVSNLNLVYA